MQFIYIFILLYLFFFNSTSNLKIEKNSRWGLIELGRENYDNLMAYVNSLGFCKDREVTIILGSFWILSKDR